MLFNVKE